jgi:capsular exopolysaccharide synthesis family protein
MDIRLQTEIRSNSIDDAVAACPTDYHMSRIWDAIQRSDPLLIKNLEVSHGAEFVVHDEPPSDPHLVIVHDEPPTDSHLIKVAFDAVIKIAGASIQIGPGASIAVHSDPAGVFADRCRFIRAQLHQLWNMNRLKSLLITSPFREDGKSTVALNLAIVLGERGKRRVLLIEADLHHPTITQRLDLDPRQLKGLSDCLEGGVDPFSAICWLEPIEIYLLPAGKLHPNPTELLQTDALSGMMQSFREHFDWVLVDSPPLQPLSDALLLRQRTDSTLLVARAGRTLTHAMDEAVTLLGKRNIVGMLLNGVEGLDRAYTSYRGASEDYRSKM